MDHLGELEKLAPKPGEWLQLRADREPLRHGAQLEVAYGDAARALDEALPHLEEARRAWARSAGVLPEAQGESDRLRSTLLEVEDLLATAQDQSLRWGRDAAQRLEAVEARLALYERMARRLRCEPDELSERFEALKAERKELEG